MILAVLDHSLASQKCSHHQLGTPIDTESAALKSKSHVKHILSQTAEVKVMKLVTFRSFLIIGGLAVLVLIGGTYEARAQGRGRGQSNEDKKCSKFVNCHDASEGRWDGRGPQRDNDSDNWKSRHSHRGRDFDNFDNQRRYRRSHHDGNFDRKRDWRRHDYTMRRHQTWDRRRR